MTSAQTTVCLARFHDGTAKPNWGGRATSLALAGVIDRSPGHRLVSVVNGHLITADFPEFAAVVAPSTASKVLDRLGIGTGRKRSRKEDLFARVEEIARQLATATPAKGVLADLQRSIRAADEFWMNGEGDFILAPPRRTLFRTLVYMQMAVEMGKPVRLVNSILSLPPGRKQSQSVVDAVGRMLARCASIAYRDPESLRLSEQLFPGLAATWTPDALFDWWRTGAEILAWPGEDAYYGPAAEGLPPEVQALLRDGAPIAVLSGSSAVTSGGEDSERAVQPLKELVQALAGHGLRPVVAATCSGDDWMRRVAIEAGCPFVPATVPLISGMLLLSRARCFVSGRYHPSILAAIVGAPVVLMTSNSHKTRSLQEVIGMPAPREYPFLTQSADVAPIIDASLAAAATCDATRASLAGRMARLEQQVHRMAQPATFGMAA